MTLVDTNVLLDLLTADPKWADWSTAAIETASATGSVLINDIIYAELSVGFSAIEMLERFIEDTGLVMATMPRAALFLAAKAHRIYGQAGGSRVSVLPDFFIGAQAAVLGVGVLTRDATRFRAYFPTVEVISPS